jgi:hypothetical protein
MRASDSDREQVTDRLRRATAEGRLLAHELEERLARALRAKTYGELDAVVADLPGERVAGRRAAAGQRRRHLPHPVVLVAAIPIIIAAVAMVMALAVFVISGVFAVWMVWLVLGWWFFGHGRHHHHRRGGPPFGPRRVGSRVGPWT